MNNTYWEQYVTIFEHISYAANAATVITGTIGGICNFSTLTTAQWHRNPCVFYLLCANTFQLLSILYPVLTRVLSAYFGVASEIRSVVWCKIRLYCIFTLPELATLYVLLSAFDRYLATSSDATFRAWSRLKIAHRISFGMLLFGCITNLHIIVFQTNNNGNCQFLSNQVYEIFFAVYSTFVISLLPQILMLICCGLILFHLKQAKHRVAPMRTVASKSIMKRFETQLIIVSHDFSITYTSWLIQLVYF